MKNIITFSIIRFFTGKKSRYELAESQPDTHHQQPDTHQVERRGETQSFKLLELISSKWWDAGIRLGLTIDTLENYKQKTEDNDKRLEYIFSQWIDSNGHSEYPLTWDGLTELLRDIDKDSAAEELLKVLENRCELR